jgi:hypothetical protein
MNESRRLTLALKDSRGPYSYSLRLIMLSQRESLISGSVMQHFLPVAVEGSGEGEIESILTWLDQGAGALEMT